MKVKELLENNDWDNDGVPEPDTNDVDAQRAAINQQLTRAKHDLEFYQGFTYNVPHYTKWSPAYDKLLPTAKYTFGKELGGPGLIPNDTPNAEQHFHNYKKYYPKVEELTATVKKLEKEQKSINKKWRAKQFANVGTANVNQQDIDNAMKIQKFVIGKNKINNTMLDCPNSQYVGPPEQYPDLTTFQQDALLKIQPALKAAGKQPISILYGGRSQFGGVHYFAKSADDKFGWRKGPNIGQNHIYLAGVGKISTAVFLEDPQKYLSQMT